MFLTKQAILEEIENGSLEISPFNRKLLNPNSYNVRLGSELLVYRVDKSNKFTRLVRKMFPGLSDWIGLPPSEINTKESPSFEYIQIPEEGYVLEPGKLYLGRTLERTRCEKHVPLYEGRSSTARIGLESHICGGWGDVGFDGTWTLEIRATYPTRVFSGFEIGQVAFAETKGEVSKYGSDEFRSRYQGQKDPTPYRGNL